MVMTDSAAHFFFPPIIKKPQTHELTPLNNNIVHNVILSSIMLMNDDVKETGIRMI